MCVCVYFFFIHSFIDECLGCFHILAVVNRAAMDMAVLIPLQDPFLGVRAHAMQQAGSWLDWWSNLCPVQWNCGFTGPPGSPSLWGLGFKSFKWDYWIYVKYLYILHLTISISPFCYRPFFLSYPLSISFLIVKYLVLTPC